MISYETPHIGQKYKLKIVHFTHSNKKREKNGKYHGEIYFENPKKYRHRYLNESSTKNLEENKAPLVG